jgi:hypothetical protein
MTARTPLVTLLAASVVVLSGCADAAGEAATGGGQTPAAVASPRDDLLKAIPDETVGAYHFIITGGSTPMSGVLDAPKKTARIEVSQSEPSAGFTLAMTFLIVDQKAWTKISFTPANLPGLPKLPKKWMLLDPAKVKDTTDGPLEYADETDPASTSLVVQNSSNLKVTSHGHYAGTTDLTKSTDADIVDPATITALGAKAKAVPFTAVVDGQGHLTSLVVSIPAAGKTEAGKTEAGKTKAGKTKAAEYAVTYDGYGRTASPAVPAAVEQQKAVPAVYDMLNG